MCAFMLGFLALGKGEMGGEEEGRLRFPSAYHVPVTEPGLSEWGLLDPSQQPCRVGSIILTLRAGSWCSKELPPVQDCGMQASSVGVQGTCSCPPVRQHDGWRAFCQDLVVGFCPSLVKGRVRRFVAILRRLWLEGVVKLWRYTCVIRSLSYVQENHEAHLFCEVSWGYSDKVFKFNF